MNDDNDQFDRILVTLTSEGVRQQRIGRTGRLPHVGLGPPAGSMYGGPIREAVEQERAAIRVQATVGKPLKELQDIGWHWGTEGEGLLDAES